MTRTAVLTVVHGRAEHLAAQERSLAAGTRAPNVRVVVALGDPALTGPDVVHLPADPAALPLAAGRNLAARTALEAGAEVLVFLDVDCMVGAGTVAAYAAAAAEHRRTVWSGPVTYLPAEARPYRLADLPRLDAPHAARPAPAAGEQVAEERWELFWSLSFALHREAWDASGGFDEAYAGYGAEDTDFGQRCARAGLDLRWDGSARAYHQHHPVSRPPVEHAADIVRNGRLFAERWGWWPMAGWLEEMAELGVVRRRDEGWELVDGDGRG
ncbi:glycosyltransferase family 2 protein [Nocardioides zeae]|uniref:N-acetylglucosaminyl-diphospho-decaprenol L-rhamnosyltransferase n=1 Tax=Nocardioides zeae TaxID=1457234 RepID=A0AAJ1U8Z7_9ACTN|nr:galactosyltransferase-related protein [Nocardioides zeae]MDQ1106586.1 N-acetylglucosaminyl-diphospho-decaprenol L-rhamnosyltransferase [Nocardioides zeae]